MLDKKGKDLVGIEDFQWTMRVLFKRMGEQDYHY